MPFHYLYQMLFGDRKGDDNRFADNRPTQEKDNHNIARDSQSDFGGNDTRNSFFDCKITTDPSEMHRFFEETMKEVFKSFPPPHLFPDIGEFSNVPTFEENLSPRDRCLKPEYRQTKPENNVKKEIGIRDSFFDFKITPDPSEMHRFFEETMKEVFKSFPTPHLFPGIGDFSNVPAFEENINLRDQCLKPEYRQTKPENNIKEEIGIRSKVSDWLSQLLPSPIQPVPPGEPNIMFSSCKRVIRSTVILPDGTVKTQEIIRNSDGTEHIIETQSFRNEKNHPLSEVCIYLNEPQINTSGLDLTKPGFENISPNGEKIDKEIVFSDIERGSTFLKSNAIPESNESYGWNTVTSITVTSPNGNVVSEERVYSNGTVIHTLPFRHHLKPSFGKSSDMAQSIIVKGVEDVIDLLFK